MIYKELSVYALIMLFAVLLKHIPSELTEHIGLWLSVYVLYDINKEP